jgi:hypothetical protein
MLRIPYIRVTLHRPAPTLGGVLSRDIPVADVGIEGPQGARVLRCRVDSAADDTIFPLSLAQQIGIDLTGAPVGESQTASGITVSYRCAQVTLRVTDGIESCQWVAIVGFLDTPRRTGLLGLSGFLGYFDTTLRGSALEVLLDPNPAFPGRHRTP